MSNNYGFMPRQRRKSIIHSVWYEGGFLLLAIGFFIYSVSFKQDFNAFLTYLWGFQMTFWVFFLGISAGKWVNKKGIA